MLRICCAAGLLCLVGCATANGPMDLVYGPQRIPPPTTGSAAAVASRGTGTAPYYSGGGGSQTPTPPQRPSQVLPSTTPPASNALPPGSSPYVPPDGTFDYRGSTSSRNSGGTAPARPLSSGGSGSPPAGGNGATSPFRPLGPPPSSPASPGTGQPGRPAPGSAAGPAISAGDSQRLAGAESGWKPAGSRGPRPDDNSVLFAQRRSRTAGPDASRPAVRPVRYEIPEPALRRQ